MKISDTSYNIVDVEAKDCHIYETMKSEIDHKVSGIEISSKLDLELKFRTDDETAEIIGLKRLEERKQVYLNSEWDFIEEYRFDLSFGYTYVTVTLDKLTTIYFLD